MGTCCSNPEESAVLRTQDVALTTHALSAEAALEAEAARCIAASDACTRCGCTFSEKWESKPWHCFECKEPIPVARAKLEDAAEAAAERVDAPFMVDGKLTAEGERRHADRGVQVAFLKALVESRPAAERRTLTTAQVVAQIVKPQTARLRCRYVELPQMRPHVGKPRAFVSHTWSALFSDLVAAIAHAFADEQFVWVDIFAVRQVSQLAHKITVCRWRHVQMSTPRS